MTEFRQPSPWEDRNNYLNALGVIAEASENVLQDLGKRLVRGAQNYASFKYSEHVYDTLFESSSNPEGSLPPITADELCEAFSWMGKDLMRTGRAQFLGNHIYPYKGGLRITDRPKKQGRVTHVRITERRIGNNWFPVTHEIHFPSKDSGSKDYSVAGAIFVRHEYDDGGERTASHSHFVETIHPHEGEVYGFISDIRHAYKVASGAQSNQ